MHLRSTGAVVQELAFTCVPSVKAVGHPLGRFTWALNGLLRHVEWFEHGSHAAGYYDKVSAVVSEVSFHRVG